MLAAASIAVLAGAGCGSSGPATLSRAAFIEQANAICATAVTRTSDLIEEAFAELFPNRPPTQLEPPELQQLYADILPAARAAENVLLAMLAELRAMHPPEEIETEVSDLWSAVDARLSTGLARIELAVDDPEAAVALDVDDAFPFEPENARARRRGLTDCSFS